jgi:hypothetical protein
MYRCLRAFTAAALVVSAFGIVPSFAQKSGGILRVHAIDSPPSLSMHEEPASARLALARRSGDDQGDRARAHVILRVDQFPQQLRVITITSDVPRECRVNSDPLRPV